MPDVYYFPALRRIGRRLVPLPRITRFIPRDAPGMPSEGIRPVMVDGDAGVTRAYDSKRAVRRYGRTPEE